MLKYCSKEKDKMELKNYEKIIIEIFMLSLILGVSLMIGALKGDDFKKQYTLYQLKNNFVEKNLSFIDGQQTFLQTYYSDRDFETYNTYFQSQYKYDINTMDCKQVSFNWIMYLQKHNYQYKIMTTNNHMFVISYDDNGWCLFDLNYTMCRGMVLK